MLKKIRADSPIRKINAREIAISAKPMAIKIPRLFSDVIALNNSMPPNSPRNNTAVPWITKSKDTAGVINGKKTPASNAKIAST